MDFNSILIGSEDPQRLVEYYTRLFGEPAMADGGYTGWLIGAASSPSARTTRSGGGTLPRAASSGTSSQRT